MASIGKRRLYSSGCLSMRSIDELGGDDPKRDKEDEEKKRPNKKEWVAAEEEERRESLETIGIY